MELNSQFSLKSSMAEKFEYKYSAPTKEERRIIENIKNQYLPPLEKDKKLARLKQLDKKVKDEPVILGLTLGIIGILIFGLGLTFILEWNLWLYGIIIALVGVIVMSITYPLYNNYKKKLTNKYSKEILDLANELLNE